MTDLPSCDAIRESRKGTRGIQYHVGTDDASSGTGRLTAGSDISHITDTSAFLATRTSASDAAWMNVLVASIAAVVSEAACRVVRNRPIFIHASAWSVTMFTLCGKTPTASSPCPMRARNCARSENSADLAAG